MLCVQHLKRKKQPCSHFHVLAHDVKHNITVVVRSLEETRKMLTHNDSRLRQAGHI